MSVLKLYQQNDYLVYTGKAKESKSVNRNVYFDFLRELKASFYILTRNEKQNKPEYFLIPARSSKIFGGTFKSK